MNRLILTCLLLLSTVAAATPVLADGCFLPTTLHGQTKPSSAAQKAIMIAEGQDQVLLLQTTYHGPADRFAWVVPVPARPSETFAAEPAFLTETFRETEPVVVTKLGQDRRRRLFKSALSAGTAAPAAPGAAGASLPPPVQVLEEREVGDYHAVVLAATQGGELQKWLGRNGYRLPAEAEPVLSGYVQRGWVFVALKMQEQRAREQAVLTEVAPLGLRFRRPQEGLVYPLTISRVSAPPLSAVLLCVIADGPYTCQTLPAVWLTEQVEFRRNQTYGDLRRQMTRNPTRLLCEFSGGAPFHHQNLGYRASDWETGRSGNWHTRQASRFFGLLAPAEMTDLTFAPDTEASHADYRVLVQRRGPEIPRETAALLTHAVALQPGSSEQKEAMDKPLTPPRWHAPRRTTADDWRLVAAFLLVMALVVWLLVRFVPGPTALLMGVGLALVLVAGVAQSGAMMPGLAVLNAVQAAVDLFQADTGCLPATVADLAARQAPATGLDASDNPAPVHGWRGPYLVYVPPDPIRGGHLVMDPLNAFALDTTGLQTTCGPATYNEAQGAAGKHGHELEPYWATTPAQVVGWMRPYNRWLQAHSGHHVFAFATGVNTGNRSDVTAIAVDRHDLSYFPVTGGPCGVSSQGQVLTWHEARRWEDTADGAGDVVSFCGVTSASDAFRLLPRAKGMAKGLALGPHGAALVSTGDGLALLQPDGGKRDYPWEAGGIWSASFSRDGRTVYIVSRMGTAGSSGTMLARLNLATGRVAVVDTGLAEAPCAAGLDGVVYVKAAALWQVAGGAPRLLVRQLPESPDAVALARDYAYWAVSGRGDVEGNTIYRVSLRTGQVKPVAHFGLGRLIMAADGEDLYTAHRLDSDVDRITLLAGGRRPIRLGGRPELAAPANLPRVD
ncbi:DUF2330 domain-containing protein [bacterium]|nr:DUF2330 domain-containing protein [bacterium]